MGSHTASAARDKRSRRSHGGITLAEVARLAGVSPITASRALNTPEQVSAGALQKVRDAVQLTGYVPNLLAGGLASSRSRLVAAVVPAIGGGTVFMEMVQSLTESLATSGYQLMLGQSGYAQSREDALLDAIIGRRPDGLVLTGVMHSLQGRRRLQASGIPVVETWDLTPTPIDMLVGFSHERVGTAVADYLHAKGRRRLAIMSGDDERAVRRTTAFVARARSHLGADATLPSVAVGAPSTVGSGRRAFAKLLDEHPDIDALCCGSDVMAAGAIIEAQVRGMRVPADLAVIGFGDLGFSADLHPALTTVRIDGTAIGRQAASFIVERAAGRGVAERVVDIGFSIVERASA
ncbi:MAG TPA: LacI family DNA-binding transcriptional regulator [Albitalea sp.]|nr:LacI family DNA-binding transcriptional regulator [Albitalea sp.]